jgi:hypothetical protein
MLQAPPPPPPTVSKPKRTHQALAVRQLQNRHHHYHLQAVTTIAASQAPLPPLLRTPAHQRHHHNHYHHDQQQQHQLPGETSPSRTVSGVVPSLPLPRRLRGVCEPRICLGTVMRSESGDRRLILDQSCILGCIYLLYKRRGRNRRIDPSDLKRVVGRNKPTFNHPFRRKDMKLGIWADCADLIELFFSDHFLGFICLCDN